MHDNGWSSGVSSKWQIISSVQFVSNIRAVNRPENLHSISSKDFIVKNMLIPGIICIFNGFHDVKFFIRDKNNTNCLSNQTMIAVIPLPILYRPQYRLFLLCLITYLWLRTSTMQIVNAYHQPSALRRYYWTLKYAHYIIKLVSKQLLIQFGIFSLFDNRKLRNHSTAIEYWKETFFISDRYLLTIIGLISSYELITKDHELWLT